MTKGLATSAELHKLPEIAKKVTSKLLGLAQDL